MYYMILLNNIVEIFLKKSVEMENGRVIFKGQRQWRKEEHVSVVTTGGGLVEVMLKYDTTVLAAIYLVLPWGETG